VKRLRVGVVYGGRSSEHEVSLASAAAIIANLDRNRYEPVPIRIERSGRWTLADKPPTAESAAATIETARAARAIPARESREVHLMARPGEETVLTLDRTAEPEMGDERAVLATLSLDVIFPILHGPYGEDGTLQGLLELADVPYVGAGVLASATGMDKAIMKILFAAAGLPLVRHDVVRRRDWREAPDTVVERLESRLRYPLFVKPANLGSSVGISRVEDMEALKAALDLAAEYDRKLVVEEGVAPCREIECAVIGNDRPDTSVLGEIVPSGPFYDYKAKYLDDRSETIIPAQLTDAQAARIRTMAADAFKAIDGAGMARVDFLLASDTGDLFVNEINTHPGFTTISMFAKLWDATELPYPQLLNRLIELAAERHAEKQDTRTTVG